MNLQFSFIFIAALILTPLLRLFLALRQIRHVLAHRAMVPAEFSSRITLESHQKAADYTVARTRLGLIELSIDLVFLLALTFGGGLNAIDALWRDAVSGLSYGLAIIYSVILLSSLVNLPLSLYSAFVLEARFGFNRMTQKLFVLDLIKQTLLGLLIGTPILLCILWLMNVMGTYWWLYVWGVVCLFILLLQFIYPSFIAPLFNTFTPLEAGALKTRIEALLARCGFASDGLFVADGSKRSTRGNAYFTGFGKTKRIVFFDTLIEHLSPDEVEAVLAHELGHFKHRHILFRLALTFAISFIFFALLGQLIDAPWFFAALHVDAQNMPMAFILFFMILPLFSFPLTPLMSWLSRTQEFEADQYAVKEASAEALSAALVKLYTDRASTTTPDPLHSLFYDSHPPASLRIARMHAHE